MNLQESRRERTASCTFDSLKRKSFNVKLYPAAFTTLVLIHRKRWRNAQKSKKRHETFLRGRYSFLFLTLLLRHFFCFLCKPVMITTVKHNKCSYRPDSNEEDAQDDTWHGCNNNKELDVAHLSCWGGWLFRGWMTRDIWRWRRGEVILWGDCGAKLYAWFWYPGDLWKQVAKLH